MNAGEREERDGIRLRGRKKAVRESREKTSKPHKKAAREILQVSKVSCPKAVCHIPLLKPFPFRQQKKAKHPEGMERVADQEEVEEAPVSFMDCSRLRFDDSFHIEKGAQERPVERRGANGLQRHVRKGNPGEGPRKDKDCIYHMIEVAPPRLSDKIVPVKGG